MLSQACVNQTELAKEEVENRLLSPGSLTYRNVENYPGKIVCGDYAAGRRPQESSYKPFIFLPSGLLMVPSEEDQAVFCGDNPQKALFDKTGINFSGIYKANVLLIRKDYNLIATALEQYQSDNFWLPKTNQGLVALRHSTEIEPKPRAFRDGGYLKKVPNDPWGAPYIYAGPVFAGVQGSFKLLTLGADGKEGGENEDADVEWHHIKYIDHINRLN